MFTSSDISLSESYILDRKTRLDRGSPLDFVALEEVALYHTHHETDYDMGTVNF